MMENLSKVSSYVLLGLIVFVVGVYASGNRISVKSAVQTADSTGGQGKGTPGWREGNGEGNAVGGQGGAKGTPGWRKGAAGGPGARLTGNTGPAGGPGSGRGQGVGAQARAGRAGGNPQGVPGQQPGFGPSGGILLPILAGTKPVPVLVNGQEKGAFVGRDLIDHVEDTVIATADGPRKGWGVGKTLAYLGVKDVKEVSMIDNAGNKTTVTPAQILDTQTFVLLTYNEKGLLMLASGPKVRGTNKGMTSKADVLKMVEGRKDLYHIPDVVKIEVKS